MRGAVVDQPDNLVLRRPRQEEAAELCELCVRSKASWGYDAAFLEQCRPSLGIDMELAGDGLAVVADLDGRPAGVAQILVRRPGADLDLLFVEPAAFGRSVGSTLLGWASRTARARGAAMLRILSDPGATEFYLRRGAQLVGEIESEVVAGRRLPLMVLDLREPT